MVARKPQELTHIEAASSPIGAITAWQMLFDYAQAITEQTVLIHGAAGNVGAYAVQLARRGALRTIATASTADLQYVKNPQHRQIVDYRTTKFEDSVNGVDIVLDTVGEDTQQRSLSVVKPGGILVSVVTKIPEEARQNFCVSAAYSNVEVTTARLNKITELFDEGTLVRM